MTRSEQERLVERYLGGLMKSAEEEEFFIMVAVDHDLRQTLKAYRIVESAIRKHRDTAPIQHAASRMRVMAMLSADATATQHGGTSVAGTAGRAGAGSIVGKGAVAQRWVMASVAATALVVGAFVVAPLMQQQQTASQVRITPAQQQTPMQHPEMVPSTVPVTGTKPDVRESTLLPQAEGRTANVSAAPVHENTAQRNTPEEIRHMRSGLQNDRGAERKLEMIQSDTASKQIAPSVTPDEKMETNHGSTATTVKSEGQAKVVDSAAHIRLQFDPPK